MTIMKSLSKIYNHSIKKTCVKSKQKTSSMGSLCSYPHTMKEEWEAFFGEAVPLRQGVHNTSRSLERQFAVVEKLRGQ